MLIGWKSANDELVDEAESIRRWEHATKLLLQGGDGFSNPRPENVGIWARLFGVKRRKNY